MADYCKFVTKLNSFLENDSIRESDFSTYIAMLRDLAKLMEQQNGFHTHAPVVKNWISQFETIFSENKVQENERKLWRANKSKFCPSITKLFLSLLRSFHQFEPKYTQEFYVHWRSSISGIIGSKRAESFIQNADAFKIVIQHLRTAEQRCEQFAILSVLILYIENVPISDLSRLNENDNVLIVNKIAQLMEEPTILNKHSFLHDIDTLGHCIESLKPQRIVCKKLDMQYDTSEHEIWLDFNKKDKSIIFVTVSLTDNDCQSLCVGGRIKLRENFYDDHKLEINGLWNVMVNKKDAIQKTTTVQVFFLEKIQSAVSKSVRNAFVFVQPGLDGSVSQDRTKGGHTIDDANIETPPEKLHRVNDSLSSGSPLQFTPKASDGLQRSGSRITLPATQRPLQKLNSSLPLFAAKWNEMDNIATIAERSADPNLKYESYVRQSIDPIVSTNNKVKAVEPSTDPNLTCIIRKSVHPIAQQSEYDRTQQEGDREDVAMDSFNTGDTYTIENCAISNISDNMPMSIEDKPLVDDDRSSGISFNDEVSAGEDEKYHHSEHDVDMPDDKNESENHANHAKTFRKNSNKSFGKKKVHVIEDITIVPPTIQNESLNGYLPRTGRAKYVHFSQTEETVSASRREPFNVYSQPTTPHERLYVKESTNSWRTGKKPQEPIDDSDERIQNTRKSSKTAESQNSPQPMHFDRTVELSPEQSQRIQDESRMQIGYSSQDHNDLFVPHATSTKRAQTQDTSKSWNESQQGEEAPLTPNNHSSQNQYELFDALPTSLPLEKTSQAANTSTPSIGRSRYLTQPSSQGQIKPSGQPKSKTDVASKSLTRNEWQEDREESSTQIGYTPQTQYDMFLPPVTSTQRTKQRQIESIIPPESVTPKTPKSKTLNESRSRSGSLSQAKWQSQSKSLSQDNRASERPQGKNSQERAANKTSSGLIVQPPTSATQKALKKSNESSTQATEQKSQSKNSSRNRVIEAFIPPKLDLPASQKISTSLMRNPSHKEAVSFIQQNDENAEIFELVEIEAPQKAANSTQKRTKTPKSLLTVTPLKPSTKLSARKPLQPLQQSENIDTLGKLFAASRISKKNPRNTSRKLAKPTAAKARKGKSETRNSFKNKLKMIATQETDSAIRYSSLKRSKAVATRRSSKTDHSDKNESITEAAAANGIHVDDSGRVYDDKGCVFADNDELQRAAKFFIAKDGLEYMKTESFKALPAGQRNKYEHKFKAIHEMIDNGLETIQQNDNQVEIFDPYQLSNSESHVRVVRSTKKVSHITTTTKEIMPDGSEKLTITRRNSKLIKIVDKGTSNEKFNIGKTQYVTKKFDNIAKSLPSKKVQPVNSVNFNSKKSENRPKEKAKTIHSDRDNSSSNLANQATAAMNSGYAGATNTSKRLPCYATPATKAQHQHTKISSTAQSNRNVEMGRLPIYASDANRKNVISTTTERKRDQPLRNPEQRSTVINCGADVSMNDVLSENINENQMEVGNSIHGAGETDLCSTMTCNENLNDLVSRLKEIANDPETCRQQKRILVNFIESLHPAHSQQNTMYLFNGFLDHLEMTCDEASELLESARKDNE